MQCSLMTGVHKPHQNIFDLNIELNMLVMFKPGKNMQYQIAMLLVTSLILPFLFLFRYITRSFDITMLSVDLPRDFL